MRPCLALIVAGGTGERFGGPVPKQYRQLAGVPVVRRAVEAFRRHPGIEGVRVVTHAAHRPLALLSLAGLDIGPLIAGGASRQASVAAGLEAIAPMRPAAVLVHDAARPLVDAATITRVIDALDKAPAAIAAVALTDTLKRADLGRVAATLDRSGLWRAQTPQGFHFEAILQAHRAATGRSATDDAALAEAAGLEVLVVEGHVDNIKITTEADLERAARLIGAGPDVRVGNGLDVHRFGPGSAVRLCGVDIPHDAGLVGHSDADVGLHALTDAILGAAGAGDIGTHFPPSDERWRGADSSRFVRHAASLAMAAGGRITHVDITLVCERPHIAAHRQAMRQAVAGMLGLAAERVGIKATTTEGLGFAGRGEGIAAMATATVVFS